MNIKFRFVCATRVGREIFHRATALGRSLDVYRAPFVELELFPNNERGLPSVYNEALSRSASDPAVLIFVHDDVHICDLFWPMNLVHGLQAFDIVGVAGTTHRLPGQPSWCFKDLDFTLGDPGILSGSVGHGDGFPPESVSRFGPPRKEVKLLDGLFLAVRSETLLSRNIWFDERFDFHFYDLDFCRQAECLGLRMGTWTISLVHVSKGDYASPSWRQGYRKYIDKWKS